MTSDLAIIHALQCSLNPDAECLGDACPYFAGKTSCTDAAKQDAIERMHQINRLQKRLRKEGRE